MCRIHQRGRSAWWRQINGVPLHYGRARGSGQHAVHIDRAVVVSGLQVSSWRPRLFAEGCRTWCAFSCRQLDPGIHLWRTCFELSFLLVPASRQANATATQYNVQNFRSMSGSGLVELALCWTAGGSANGVAVGELFLHGPNQTVLRTIAHGERLVVSADWWRSPASDEWVCLLKSCGQPIDDATATCAQRAVATLAGVEEDVFDLGHVAADAALLYLLCLCSNYSGRTCKDRLPVDFTVDVGEVTLLCGAAQRPQDDMCVPCGPGHYKPANLRQNDCVPCPIGRVAPAGSESCSLCSGANFSAGHVCQVCDAGRWPSDHLSGAAIGCAAE